MFADFDSIKFVHKMLYVMFIVIVVDECWNLDVF
jgi:hypothetical protein